MPISPNPNSQNPLLEIAAKYKNELRQPASFVNDVLHYHEKNPDASLQIKLLEEADKVINEQVSPEGKSIAQLGIILILRDLLIDPNRENEIYSYLIEKLELDSHINSILNKIFPNMKFDLTDQKFLEFGKKALNVGRSIIEADQIKTALPNDFLQYIKDIIFVENDYTNKVLTTIEASKPQSFF